MGANLTFSKDQHHVGEESPNRIAGSRSVPARNELSIRCACSFDFKRLSAAGFLTAAAALQQ